jgi:hypothetical protein
MAAGENWEAIMPFVRLRWTFGAEQHFRTIRGRLWRFDKHVPVDVPDGVMGEIAEHYSDVLEQVEEVEGKPGKWKPMVPEAGEAKAEAGKGKKAKAAGKPKAVVGSQEKADQARETTDGNAG